MEYNRLRLNKEEYELITRRYPDIDYKELMSLAEGMSTIRNIDMLISSLEYDIEHKDFEEAKDALEKQHYVILCKDIRDKAIYYRDHNGKNYVKGFNTDLFTRRADEIAKVAVNDVIGSDIYKIDQSINYIKSITDRIDSDQKLWNIAVYLGTKLGELMLDGGLLSYGFDWDIIKPKKYPIIIEPNHNETIDPIRFVFDKIKYQSENPDPSGTCSDFFYRFLDHLRS